jgi:hypothetical protein
MSFGLSLRIATRIATPAHVQPLRLWRTLSTASKWVLSNAKLPVVSKETDSLVVSGMTHANAAAFVVRTDCTVLCCAVMYCAVLC